MRVSVEYATVRTVAGTIKSGPVVGDYLGEYGSPRVVVVDETGAEVSGVLRDRWMMAECDDCGAWLPASTLAHHVGSSWCPCARGSVR